MERKSSTESIHDLIFKQQYTDRLTIFMEKLSIWLSLLLMILTLPFSLLFALVVVYQYEKAVVVRLGKLICTKGKGPGVIVILPCTDKILKVDLRTMVEKIQTQEVLTKDSCTIVVDAVIYFNVFDPIGAIMQVENYQLATVLLTATILRKTLGHKNLIEILSERTEIASFIQDLVDRATDPWGVMVERVEIMDVCLPIPMQRAMAAEAEATREARAKVVAAEGELRAAKNLKDASDVLIENPTALRLRYLQTMNSISAEKTSTILFPLPFDLISVFDK